MKSEEMIDDLREIITMDEEAQVIIIYNGRTIIGTKGDLINASTFDRDDGGIYSKDDYSATFVLNDFPDHPDGSEIIFANGDQKRIVNVKSDDFGVAIVLELSTPNEQ